MTRVVVWITEGTWQGCVDAAAKLAPQAAEFVLLHVEDAELAEVVHGAYGGLFGRGRHDPGETVTGLAGPAARELLDAAAERLGRPSTSLARGGEVAREVVAVCADADLLVCARDGAHDRLGPRSIGKQSRFVIDHAPCAVLVVWPDEGAVPSVASIPPKPPKPGRPPKPPGP
ncbi:MAG TPA: universal stress protein [Pseudonocardiaceae bacterium]|jgi:nucleotide-binding universal stress UspA family protein|nr:universal stress protein [Pseudonocardiaceae bacterium]